MSETRLKRAYPSPRKGLRVSDETRRRMSEAQKGEKGSNWKGGISKTKDYRKNYMKKWWKKVHTTRREFLYNLLGDKCARCGFSDKRALQFDHINGGGDQECLRITGKKRNRTHLYKYYVEHPEEAKKNLQVLCSNCNWIKRVENNECKNCGNHKS